MTTCPTNSSTNRIVLLENFREISDAERGVFRLLFEGQLLLALIS